MVRESILADCAILLGNLMAVEFRLLGGVEARDGERLIDIGHARQRSVLAGLLVDANRVVSAEQLADRVWGGRRTPAHPMSALQTYISLLRRSVAVNRQAEADGQAVRAGQVAIVRQGSGYKMTVDPDTVDLHRFRRLVGQARAASDDEASFLLEEALALWCGEPFAGLDTSWVNAMRTSLAAQRLAVQLDLVDVQLRRGQHAAVAGELAGLTADHPLDERLAGQYMTALYGSGRQDGALARYQEIRGRLADVLGCDPGPPLQRLHQRILAADPALTGSPAPAPTPAAGPARGQALTVVPRQLPADVPGFTGRAAYLAELDRLLLPDVASDGMPITAVMGAPGVGKTSLAVHWAHRIADRFPDGQLYVNLRGFDPEGLVMDPAEAVRVFLEALGVLPGQLPSSPDAQAAMYRSLLSGRRVLVMLDNARDSRQVRSLLPGTSACLVVVTSRNQLSDLVADGARPLSLGLLPAREAGILLTRRLGEERMSAEPPAVEEIIAQCAGLPLALAIVAAKAAITPGLPLSRLAAELRDRLAVLAGETSDTGVRAVFSWSYRALSPAAARLFRLLGLHPGPDISVPAASALGDLDSPETRRLLAVLTEGNLLEEPLPGRYRFHDLIRAYAAEQAAADETPGSRAETASRLLAWYLSTAVEAGRVLSPGHRHIPLNAARQLREPLTFEDYEEALAWCDAEQASMVACVRFAAEAGHDNYAWQLPVASWSYFVLRKPWADWLACARIALGAARRCGDRFAEAWVLNGFGLAYAGRQPAEAIDCYREAFRIRYEIGDRLGESAVLTNLGAAYWAIGKFAEGLDCFQRALAINRDIENRYSQVISLNNLGEAYHELGRFAEALPCHQEALSLSREENYRMSETVALHNLGGTYRAIGRLDDADDCLRQALSLRQQTGDRHGEALTLCELGDLLQETDRLAEARRHWQLALTIVTDLDSPETADVRRRLETGTTGPFGKKI
jgi:DNA-binding SARP family transcriptional activator/tetratricopeptide (TPR) repeat protein